MTFDKFVVWSWSGKLFLGKVCGVTLREEGVVWKCICTCVFSQWKMVEKPSCVLCVFILLKNEEGSII